MIFKSCTGNAISDIYTSDNGYELIRSHDIGFGWDRVWIIYRGEKLKELVGVTALERAMDFARNHAKPVAMQHENGDGI